MLSSEELENGKKCDCVIFLKFDFKICESVGRRGKEGGQLI
jgi:hypothetical protein